MRDSSVRWRRAVGAWPLLLLLTPQPSWSAVFEVTLQKATASVSLEVSDGFNFSASASDDDEIVDPSVDFSAYASATTFPGTTSLGRGAAYQDQFGINAVFIDTEQALGDAQHFTGSARTDYEISVRDVGPAPTGGTIPFTFVINSGEVRLRNYPALDAFPFFEVFGVASVTAEIGIEAQHWRYTTGLTLDQNGDLVQVGDSIGNVDDFGLGIFPNPVITIDGDDAYITIPRIEGTIDLAPSVFRTSSGLDFSYAMSADIFITDSFGVGALAGITDPFALGTPDPNDDLGAPFSPLGVQFFLDGQPLSSLGPSAPAPLSEPGSMGALLFLALGTAVFLGRHPRRPEGDPGNPRSTAAD